MILINKNVPTEILDFLRKKDELLLLDDLKKISDATRRHVDLGAVKINGKIVACPEFAPFIPNSICGEIVPEDGYPKDVAYNAAVVDGRLFCLENAVEKKVLEIARSEKLKTVNVKQGYTKCNVVNVGNKAVITEDVSVKAAAENEGIPVLLIQKGFVNLDGYEHGFIGGATVSIGNELIFTGDFSAHPDYEKAIAFCAKFGVSTFFMRNFPLTDVGSPIFAENI